MSDEIDCSSKRKVPWWVGLVGVAAIVAACILSVRPTPIGPAEIKEPAAIRLTKGKTVDELPRWSPSGDRVAFQRGEIGPLPGGLVPTTVEVYYVRIDSGEVTQVTHSPDHAGSYYPSWSPDGRQLVFVQEDFSTGFSALYTINDDGTNPIALAACPRPCSYPDWSSDGQRIVFVMPADKGDMGALYVLDLSRPHTLEPISSTSNLKLVSPSWSSDDSEIVAWTFPNGIWIVPLSGEQPYELESPRGREPTWSPRGDKIAFTILGDWPERDMVYVTDRSSGAMTPILSGNYDGDLGQPDWSPDGKNLAVRLRKGDVSHLYLIELLEDYRGE